MDHLLTEARNPASTNLDELSPLDLVRLMNVEDAAVAPAVAAAAEAIARVVEAVAERMRDGGRLFYIGAGTSGRLGVLDAAECPPTFGLPPGLVIGVIAGGAAALTTAVEGAEDRPEDGERDLRAHNLSAKDVVVGIATSGRTPYVAGALSHARSIGVFTAAIVCTPDSELTPLCDVVIAALVGPEVLTGSTRLKAGTATKLVLNTLSTSVMVRLGKTFGNLMVDMRAVNSKLRARANRIVRHLTGLSVEEADALLVRCNGELKTALVVQRGGVSPEEARARLSAAGGQVRSALPVEKTTSALDLILGIDGGGTSTAALLARIESDGSYRVLGRGDGGPSNLQAVGAARATAAIDDAVTRAFAAANVGRTPVAAACLGLAGAGRPSDRAVFETWARRTALADRVEVVGDVELVLAAGTADGWGVALVAGTGSMAWGRAADGRTARAGGWGPLLGDEGSAYALVLSAFSGIVHWADGRQRDCDFAPLMRRFLERLGLGGVEELVPTVHRRLDRAGIAALAPVLFEAAQAGDEAAHVVLVEGACSLASMVVAVARSLDFSEPLPLALAGGLLVPDAFYRDLVLRQLKDEDVPIGAVALVEVPAAGALRRAPFFGARRVLS